MVTIKAQTEGFSVTAMSVRRAIADDLPGWVTVSARCDVFRRRLRVMLDGPVWRRVLARRGGRARMVRDAVLAGDRLLSSAVRRGAELEGVLLEVWWR